MKLAYVMPSFNRPEALLLLLENISRQSINNRFESSDVIVSLDKTDPSLSQYYKLIEQYQKIIEYKKMPLNIKILENNTKGLVMAKNAAVRSTDAEIIMMLDDDLYMSDNYVELLYSDLTADETVGAISGFIVSSVPAISHTQPSTVVKKAPPKGKRLQTLRIEKKKTNWRSVFGKKEQVMDWSNVTCELDRNTRYEMDYFVNSYMFRGEAFKKVGGYNESLNSKTSAHEEVDFTFRIGKSGYKLLFNPFAMMWHITIGKGGIYKGKTWDESKRILDDEYQRLLGLFMQSIGISKPQ